MKGVCGYGSRDETRKRSPKEFCGPHPQVHPRFDQTDSPAEDQPEDQPNPTGGPFPRAAETVPLGQVVRLPLQSVPAPATRQPAARAMVIARTWTDVRPTPMGGRSVCVVDDSAVDGKSIFQFLQLELFLSGRWEINLPVCTTGTVLVRSSHDKSTSQTCNDSNSSPRCKEVLYHDVSRSTTSISCTATIPKLRTGPADLLGRASATTVLWTGGIAVSPRRIPSTRPSRRRLHQIHTPEIAIRC